MRFKQFLLEMAKPTEIISSKSYYHGANMEKSLFIKENGIVPPKKAQKGMFAPVKGMVYLTPYIKYALRYATNDMGQLNLGIGETSYLFEVDGKSLQDVFPDEDSIAAFFVEYYEKKYDLKVIHDIKINFTKEVNDICEKYISKLEHADNEILKTAQYKQNYKKLPSIGKKLMKMFSDEDMIVIIEAGAHLAHKGILQPSKIYAINNQVYFKKGSKFEDYSKEIERKDIGIDYKDLK